jgi:hypothetical protein
MPFTLSHAAAVLPGIRGDGAARGPLSASALVAGSFAPDLTYFAASVHTGAMEFGDVTHAPVGVVTVDPLLAAGLVGMWLLVRDPLVRLLPRGRQGRVHLLVRGRTGRSRSAASVALWFYVSAVLGATTHVVWDAFTHFDRWGVRAFPVLSDVVAGFPLYTYTQYGSSALALVALAWFTVSALRRLPASTPPPEHLPPLGRGERRAAVALVVACVLLGAAHRCVRWYQYWGRIETPLDIIPTACFGAGTGLAVGVVMYAAVSRLRGRRPDAAGTPPGRDDERAGVA